MGPGAASASHSCCWCRQRQTTCRHILAVNVNRRVIADTGLRRREYQFLAGHVLKWQSLYNVTPQQQRDDSWVWSWFPDGSLWQQAIVEHGNQAVQVLTGEFAQDGM